MCSKLRLVAHAAYALGSRLGEVVADGQQFVLAEVQERRVDGDILRFALRKAPLNESDTGADEHADAAEAVDTASDRMQRIAQCLALARPQSGSIADVPPLENVGSLVDDLCLYGERIAALQTDAHVVVVAVGESVAAQPRGIQAPTVPQQDDVGQQGQQEDPQHAFPDGEEHRNEVACRRHQDDDGGHNVEAGLQVHILLRVCENS